MYDKISSFRQHREGICVIYPDNNSICLIKWKVIDNFNKYERNGGNVSSILSHWDVNYNSVRQLLR